MMGERRRSGGGKRYNICGLQGERDNAGKYLPSSSKRFRYLTKSWTSFFLLKRKLKKNLSLFEWEQEYARGCLAHASHARIYDVPRHAYQRAHLTCCVGHPASQPPGFT